MVNNNHLCIISLVNPWHACIARVTVLGLYICVCMSVYLSTAILVLEATMRLKNDMNSFSITST